MSGLEIVGVVLATFPVVTEALKFYAEERGVVKDFFRYQHVLKRICRSLSREQASFSNSSKRFMEDVANQCGVGEGEIAEMIQDPTDPRWRQGDLVQKHMFHQKSVQQYLETVEDMNEELLKIQQLIAKYGDKGENAPPEELDKKARRRQWKKIILVLKKDEIGQRLEEARRLNAFLARLTEQNQSTTITTHLASRRSTKHYTQVRSHAIDLYETLQSKFPASPYCNCMLRHEVNLKLEFRSARTTAKGVYFHAIFASDTAFCSQWNWREIEMEPCETRRTELCQDTKHHSRVRLVIGLPSPPTSGYGDIPDLCATIIGPISSWEWLGFITSKKGRQHRIRVMDHQRSLPSFKSVETMTLAQVLRDKAFCQEHRTRLGVKLASSVMQLHTTEWLTDYWNKFDVSFLRSLDGTVDFDNPLIRRSFGTRNIDFASVARILPKPYLSASIPCLFSLGIVLLELWYRQRFEDLKNETEKVMPFEFSDPLTARRLADEMDCAANYKNSVLRCASGLDAAYTSLREDKFRDEVEEKIVSPLENDLKFYCNKESVEDCIVGPGIVGHSNSPSSSRISPSPI